MIIKVAPSKTGHDYRRIAITRADEGEVDWCHRCGTVRIAGGTFREPPEHYAVGMDIGTDPGSIDVPLLEEPPCVTPAGRSAR